MRLMIWISCVCLVVNSPLLASEPVGTAFTFQGHIKNNDMPVDATCEFTFTLWDDPAAGNQVGNSPQGPIAVDVVQGLFTVNIDFGPQAITGVGRWLQITVECPGEAPATLAPRTRLAPSPHALALPGLYTLENSSSPSVIGGFSGNAVGAGVVGGAIAGGGRENEINQVAADFGSIGGGLSNMASGIHSAVGGGWLNTAGGAESFVGGGQRNTADGTGATIAGGFGNLAPGAYAVIPGGFSNLAGGDHSFASGRGAVVRSAAATGDADGDEGTFVWCDANGNIDGRCTSTGPNQFIIQALGGVGVGTPSPAYTLHVETSTSSRAVYGLNDGPLGGLNFGVYGQTNSGGAGVYGLASGSRGGSGPGSGFGVWGETQSPDGFAGYFTGPTGSRNYFQQRVGIGTTNPLARLHVVGGLHLQGSSRDISIPNAEALQVGHWDGATFVERVRISPTGNMGIGTQVPANRLSVNGNANFTGNVGIGTQNPANRLTVNGGANFTGNVGIGTANPNHELVIQGDDPAVQIRDDTNDNSPNAARLELLERAGGNFDGGAFFWWNGETNKLLVGTKQSGVNTNVLVIDRATNSVGIGTQNPGNYRLAVNGPVRAKEIVVETGWADFVFEPDYKLRSLEEVEAYIHDHGHLPDIPSAGEVAANGVNVGEMHSKLLQKVEEMTLHMIDMDKRMKALEQENARLRSWADARIADERMVD
jgi:hypothetical protein